MDAHRATDFTELAVGRALARSGYTEPLDQVAVLTALIVRLTVQRDRAARVAAETGEPMAAFGRAIGVSRQAAARRFGRGQAA